MQGIYFVLGLNFVLCSVTAREYSVDETIIQEVLRETEVNENKLTSGLVVEEEIIVYEQQPWNETKDDTYPFASGLVSYDCLRCICMVESKCKPIGCRMDVGSLSCGYFQIKEDFWNECNKPGEDWKSCADDITCASQCVQNYMKRYASYYKCPATCEGYAREHNGGPNGCHNKNTLGYWTLLKKQQGCSNMNV